MNLLRLARLVWTCIGIRLFLREQQRVLDKQIEWALEYGLPVVLHCREAFDHIYNVLKPYQQTPLKGIFPFLVLREPRKRPAGLWNLRIS